ncbi:MATE family efflux transporter [Eisenbergiella porci]|uniref:MATE family efflux transporter n=1 Tax=Eisenbergiella porci TaxID=2652274 RepID=UPI003A93B40B
MIPENTKNDFSKGSVVKNIVSLALPMTLAQLINILYNIVDRMYIGRIPEHATLSLTGLGLSMPIITVVIAFANLFGMGGAPLCSIARGKGDTKGAEKIVGNAFTMLLCTGLLLTIIGLLFKKPLLYAFGASDATFPFADSYLSIYLLGSVFVTVSLGMNSYINAQGFARVGMVTTLIGAVLNIILDPFFIFTLGMGIQGAAIATVISQFASAAWTVRFLTSPKAILRIRVSCMRPCGKTIRDITTLGLSNFMMAITNSIVQVVCNATLSIYGGDLYVGVMTVINSIREIVSMPVSGVTNGSQPVISFNYGADKYDRIKTAIRFMAVSCIVYTTAIWGILHLFPVFFIHIFNPQADLVEAAVPSMQIYYFGFFMMSLQFSGQTVFQALGKAKYAIFFSVLRKVVIVAPLTILLPRWITPAVNGVFLAEPISNFIGGTACFVTMLIVVRKELKMAEQKE